MRAYRVEKPSEFSKLYSWLDRADFDDLSKRCGARLWSSRFVQQLLTKKDYANYEFSIFALEDDKGEIQAIFTAELRTPERDKISVKTAVNANLIFKRGCGQKEHDELVKYVCRWGYEHEVYAGDFWSLDVYGEWLEQLMGKFAVKVAEADVPDVGGRCVRHVVDVKGFVEWLFSR
jgi:hypothetical protein